MSNGFDPVTSFDASTDSANISPQTKRLEGLEYTIEEVTRYYGGFRSGSGGASEFILLSQLSAQQIKYLIFQQHMTVFQ